MGVKMNESSSFENDENKNYDDNEENQLFPTNYDYEKPKATRVRWVILCLCFFGVMCAYITRLNLSLTIVAMVKPLNNSINKTTIDDDDFDKTNAQKFDWDAKTQGLILGSFFYTYGLLQVVGARYAEQFGSKLISLVILFSSGLLSFLTPTLARLGTLPMIINRTLLGVAQSSIYPVYYCVISRWFPDTEQSRALALMSNGAFLGSILTMYLAGYLSESEFFGGWPSVFYFSGIVCLIWCVFWVCMSASEPRSHPSVNKAEILYIERNKQAMNAKHQKATPWKEIFLSKAVWSVILAKFGVDYVFWLVMLTMPQYLHHVHHFKIHQNGLINCGLNVMLIISCTLGGFLSDHFVAMNCMSRTRLRKSFQTFAVVGTNLCLIIVIMVQEQSAKAVVFILLITMLFYGMNIGGDIPIVVEMTEDFPATIFAIANGISSACGFFAPWITGYIINQNISGFDTWANVFYLAIFINTCGLIIFLLYASSEPLFKEKFNKKSQQFDLDLMNANEREDSCLLASKKEKLFENNNFNGFQDDDN